MRLTEAQCKLIKFTVADVIGEESRVWLFGSRVDDTKRGGDIDLLIETEQIIASRVRVLCKLEGRSPCDWVTEKSMCCSKSRVE